MNSFLSNEIEILFHKLVEYDTVNLNERYLAYSDFKYPVFFRLSLVRLDDQFANV